MRPRLSALVTIAVTFIAALPAAALAWAPASTATVHPGVETDTDGQPCTAGFLFTDAAGHVFLSQAAHCSATGANTAGNQCDAATDPLGTQVTVSGATKPGTLAYSSAVTMQALHESASMVCVANDFELVQVDPADVGSVNPTVPAFGGPTSLGPQGSPGDRVLTYENSALRQGMTKLSPKPGLVVDAQSPWSADVYTVTPGIPGDSGSSVMDSYGVAIGTLSTLEVAPFAGANGVSTLSLELAYAQAHSGLAGLRLVPGDPGSFQPDFIASLAAAWARLP